MRESSVSIAKLPVDRRSVENQRIGRKFFNITPFYLLFEFVILSVAGFTANFLYGTIVLHWTLPWRDMALMAMTLSCIIVAGGVLRDEYHKCATQSRATVLWTALTSALQSCALFLLVLFVLRQSGSISRGGMLCQFALVSCLTMCSRVVFSLWIRRGLSEGRLYLRRALILGDHGRIAGSDEEWRFLHRLQEDGVDVATVRALKTGGPGEAEKATLTNLVAECRTDNIDTVIIIPTPQTTAYTERVVEALAETPVDVHVLSFASMLGPLSVSASIGGKPSIIITHSSAKSLSKLVKRGLDVGLACLMILLFLPVLIAVSIAIKLESPGPILFRQTRHGYGNRHFKVFKFRSMTVVEDDRQFRQAGKNDARITKVGHFIRRTNIDELPQLVNVIIGDMSLVGPRPHPLALNESFASRIRLFHRRHNIVPGITGWAQVNGFRGETDTDEKMHLRLEHDLWYIDHWSLMLDFRILFLTIFSASAYQNAG